MRQAGPVGRHAVDTRHGADREDLLVSPEIAHDAHGRDRQQNREGLPNALVKVRETQLFFNDSVRGAKQVQTFRVHLPEYSHSQPRPWERVATYEILRDPQFPPYETHFVFKKLTEGLYEFEPH